MEDLSLHILDIVENSITAGAKKIEVRILEDAKSDLLTIEIVDDGSGMDEDTARRAPDPFFTTRSTRRVGMGLPLLAQSAEESGGGITIESKPGERTTVKATFGHSHIDRRPLGDVGESLRVLIAGHPDVRFVYEHEKDGTSHRLDTEDLKE